MNAHRRGAIITFGTDAGIFDHGDNAKQFAYILEWGMTPLEAIQASKQNCNIVWENTDSDKSKKDMMLILLESSKIL